MYYASKKYKVVCKEGCYHVKNIAQHNLVLFKSLDEAIDNGCRPCKHCMKEGVLLSIDEETIVITKREYEELLEDSKFLQCLKACGVDNWDGWDYAWEMMEDEDE